MKKLTLGIMAVAFALGVFGQIGDNNPLIVSDNAFGSIKVDSKSEFTMVAAPFEGFASQFESSAVNDGKPVANAILARDVIAVENLSSSDTMHIFKPADQTIEGDVDDYHNYIATWGTYRVGASYWSYLTWAASVIFDDTNLNADKTPNASDRLVPVGSGVFVGRDASNNPNEGFSIYAYGQIPRSFDLSQAITVTIKAGTKSILSAPGELAYLPVNLNALDWGDNTTFNEVTGIERSGRLIGIGGTSDSITYFDPDNQKQWSFVRYKNMWRKRRGALGEQNYNSLSLEDDAIVPAGLSFWYEREASSGDASLTWKKASNE